MKICKKCPKTSIEFKNERSFYHHEKTHDDEKNEVCIDCEKLFRTKTDLSSHRHSVHNQKDEYKCNHCEWIFSTKSNLKKHLKKINNGSQEEPNVPDNSNSGGTINIVYKCTECNEEYVNKWHLTRHKKNVHNKTGEQYNCSFCPKIFQTETSLNTHKTNGFSCYSLNSMIAISYTIFTKISSFRFFYILREYENKLYTTKL